MYTCKKDGLRSINYMLKTAQKKWPKKRVMERGQKRQHKNRKKIDNKNKLDERNNDLKKRSNT
jgi:hypothetical protein